MFKPKEPYRNGLDDLKRAAEDSSAQRILAARKLARTLEKLKAEQDEIALGELVQYARKTGAF